MNNLEDYPELSKWFDDNAETVSDSTHNPWIVIGANEVESKLIEIMSQIKKEPNNE